MLIFLNLGYSIVSDLIISLLTIIVLWDVKVTRRVKILVVALMSLGLMYVG